MGDFPLEVLGRTLCVPGPTPTVCTLGHATMRGNVAPSTTRTAWLCVFRKLLGGTSLPWRFVLQTNKYLVLFALAINVHPLSSCIPVHVYIAGSIFLQPHSILPMQHVCTPHIFLLSPFSPPACCHVPRLVHFRFRVGRVKGILPAASSSTASRCS